MPNSPDSRIGKKHEAIEIKSECSNSNPTRFWKQILCLLFFADDFENFISRLEVLHAYIKYKTPGQVGRDPFFSFIYFFVNDSVIRIRV